MPGGMQSTPGTSILVEPSPFAEGLTLSRVGYGAMQLAGPNVLGPPANRQEAIDVLHTAVELGIGDLKRRTDR